MLMDMYDYIIKNSDYIKDNLDPSITEEKNKIAREIWNRLDKDRLDKDYRLIGIDSSWNLIPYHGYYLYATDCVAVDNYGEFVSKPICDVKIDTLDIEGNKKIYNPTIILSSRCMELEYEMIKRSIGKADLILVDGSLQARMYDSKVKRTLEFYEYGRDILRRDDIIFIAKRTDSRSILNGKMGDIYYFDHATQDAGYSYPYNNKDITIVYARLADNLPCIKVEFGKRVDESIIRERLLTIMHSSISGYPYVLKLAHNYCEISNDDMYKIATLLGVRDIKGREPLEWSH